VDLTIRDRRRSTRSSTTEVATKANTTPIDNNMARCGVIKLNSLKTASRVNAFIVLHNGAGVDKITPFLVLGAVQNPNKEMP
jgi:hypothetical protein